jgi:hypothetical protein
MRRFLLFIKKIWDDFKDNFGVPLIIISAILLFATLFIVISLSQIHDKSFVILVTISKIYLIIVGSIYAVIFGYMGIKKLVGYFRETWAGTTGMVKIPKRFRDHFINREIEAERRETEEEEERIEYEEEESNTDEEYSPEEMERPTPLPYLGYGPPPEPNLKDHFPAIIDRLSKIASYLEKERSDVPEKLIAEIDRICEILDTIEPQKLTNRYQILKNQKGKV